MQAVYDRLQKENLPFKILMQQGNAKQAETLEKFRNDTNSVLLGTGSYWEGINIEGVSLSHVIIFKLPFPVREPIIDYKYQQSKDGLMEVSVPEMVIKLKQGIGRLIRSESDKGIVSIIDSRVGKTSKAPYKQIIWESLPIKSKTNKIEKIAAFYSQVVEQQNMLHEYGNLKEADIDAACAEIDLLYHFVQKELKKSTYVKNGKIKLVRSLRPFEIEAVTPQLKDPNNSTITLPVNIMTSYAHDNRLYGYGSSMSIIRELPVEKVVMFDECLFHPENVCANSIHGGEYEVWVVEDNMFGKIELDRACFKYEKLEDAGNNYRIQCDMG